ncbi:hypothetical protein PR048_026686 [Dryococelus australis]|uniref:Uncharacterized protein n=1 Tax=Dryococelus australis TaxID=614101 RepID=A0ABQ9GM18_9NEOP|nr:hypothetical protein PR048_026686 [Dryococelus australis]
MRSLRKPANQRHRPARLPHTKIEGSPWWEASSLATSPPWPHPNHCSNSRRGLAYVRRIVLVAAVMATAGVGWYHVQYSRVGSHELYFLLPAAKAVDSASLGKSEQRAARLQRSMLCLLVWIRVDWHMDWCGLLYGMMCGLLRGLLCGYICGLVCGLIVVLTVVHVLLIVGHVVLVVVLIVVCGACGIDCGACGADCGMFGACGTDCGARNGEDNESSQHSPGLICETNEKPKSELPDRESNPCPPELESCSLPLRNLVRFVPFEEVPTYVITRESLLASYQGAPGSIPGWVTTDFCMWASCRTIPLVGGSFRGSPVCPAPSFRHCFILTLITFIGSQDLDNLAIPNRNMFSGRPRTLPRSKYHPGVTTTQQSTEMRQLFDGVTSEQDVRTPFANQRLLLKSQVKPTRAERCRIVPSVAERWRKRWSWSRAITRVEEWGYQVAGRGGARALLHEAVTAFEGRALALT